jgi:hypothetical protein
MFVFTPIDEPVKQYKSVCTDHPNTQMYWNNNKLKTIIEGVSTGQTRTPERLLENKNNNRKCIWGLITMEINKEQVYKLYMHKSRENLQTNVIGQDAFYPRGMCEFGV